MKEINLVTPTIQLLQVWTSGACYNECPNRQVDTQVAFVDEDGGEKFISDLNEPYMIRKVMWNEKKLSPEKLRTW